MGIFLPAIFQLIVITLTTPDGFPISINPTNIVSFRSPRGLDAVSPSVHCLLFTSDAKLLSVQETCEVVAEKLRNIDTDTDAPPELGGNPPSRSKNMPPIRRP